MAQDLATQARRDIEALRHLVGSQSERLRASVLRRVGDPAMAERIVHDSFVQLWESAGRGEPEAGLSTDRLFALARYKADHALRVGGEGLAPAPGRLDPVETVSRKLARTSGAPPPEPSRFPKAEERIPAERPNLPPRVAPLAPRSSGRPLAQVRMWRPGVPAWERAGPDRKASPARRAILLTIVIMGLLLGIGAAMRADWPSGLIPPPAPEGDTGTTGPLPSEGLPPPAEAPPPAAGRAPFVDEIARGEPDPPPARSPQPEPLPSAAEEPRNAEPQPPPAPVVQPVSPPSWAAGRRVFIHHTAASALDTLLAQRVAAHLNRQGIAVVDIRPVAMQISSGSIRYFRPTDEATATAIAEGMDGLFSDSPELAPRRVLDFTHYEPKPRAGTVEIWLPSSGPARGRDLADER